MPTSSVWFKSDEPAVLAFLPTSFTVAFTASPVLFSAPDAVLAASPAALVTFFPTSDMVAFTVLAIETVLDETKRTIKKTVNEAKREFPTYTQAIGQLQEETIQATKEIGYDCIELQREAANLIPKLQERYLSYSVPWMSPTLVTEYYSRMVDNFVDNVVSATNLANNLVMVNMESIQRLTDGSRDYWRIGVENTKAISRSIREP